MKNLKIALISSFFSAFLILFVFQFSSCDDGVVNDENKPDNLTYYQPFKANSPFYNPIPINPEIDANSVEMVKSLIEQKNSQGFVLVVKEWTTPVYFADANSPLQDIKLTASWAPKNYMVGVPIPDYAEPDPSSDGHMVILDTNGGCAYDMWEAKLGSNGWKAGWANAIPLNGDGIFEKGLSCRGSGFELLQGIIWPQELEKGEINHALIFSFDHTRAGGPVSPATESDGTTSGLQSIPEGALVQLNPDLDLSTLNLTDHEKIIAKALQTYGMYCADDGGGISLYAISPLSCKVNPYKGLLPDDPIVYLNKLPVDEFRVLKLGPQSTDEAVLVANSCADFE